MGNNFRIEAEDKVYAAIKAWGDVHAHNPSFRDVATIVNLPLGTVHSICRSLRESGRITFSDNIARSLKAR